MIAIACCDAARREVEMKRYAILAAALLCAAPVSVKAQAVGPTYEQPLSAAAIRDVQARLRQLGYYGGPIDGVWGSGTRYALERFQQSRRLAATGELNQATVSAMGLDPNRLVARQAPPPAAAMPARVGPETTRAVQRQLRRVGLYRGPIDGVWGRNTELALAEYQRQNGLRVTGLPNHDSLVALGLRPEDYMSGSSLPPSAAERLNHRELERRGY
jgi:peptidoglycan hydrolase-like protein with peptidoglycan-binding domain